MFYNVESFQGQRGYWKASETEDSRGLWRRGLSFAGTKSKKKKKRIIFYNYLKLYCCI